MLRQTPFFLCKPCLCYIVYYVFGKWATRVPKKVFARLCVWVYVDVALWPYLHVIWERRRSASWNPGTTSRLPRPTQTSSHDASPAYGGGNVSKCMVWTRVIVAYTRAIICAEIESYFPCLDESGLFISRVWRALLPRGMCVKIAVFSGVPF